MPNNTGSFLDTDIWPLGDGTARARLFLMCAYVCMDPYEMFFGNYLLSYDLKFPIS